MAAAVVVAGGWVVLNLQGHPLHHVGRRAYTRASIALTMAAVATSQRNIAYCGRHDVAQELDLYLPKSGPVPYPLVVFVHGGGWSFGSKSDPIVRTYGVDLVKRGMAFASLNYRLAPRYHYPVPDQDVSCALSYLYTHAADYHLNRSKFGLLGASAGNQLAMYAALGPASQNQPWRSSVRGIVDFYGVANLAQAPAGSYLARSVERFLGPNQADQAATASPVSYTNQPVPPVLIFQGNDDRHVPLLQSQELASDLTAAGNQATLVVVDHAGHGFSRHDQPSVSQIQQQVTNFFSDVFGRTS